MTFRGYARRGGIGMERNDIMSNQMSAKDNYDIDLTRLMAYGIRDMEKVDFSNIGCDSGLKPTGGVCAYQMYCNKRGKFTTQYEKECRNKGMDTVSLLHRVKIRVSDSSRIKKVTGWQDFAKLMEQYPLPHIISGTIMGLGIDYERMSADYDAVMVTNVGLCKTEKTERRKFDINQYRVRFLGDVSQYEIQGPVEMSAHSWVIPCICILNREVIDSVEYVGGYPDGMKLDENEAIDEIMDAGESDAENVKKMLKDIYVGRKPFETLYQSAVRLSKNDRKFDRLITRISELIEIQRTLAEDDLDINGTIDSTIMNLYYLMNMEDITDEDAKKFQLKINRLLGKRKETNGCTGIKTIDDIAAELMG